MLAWIQQVADNAENRVVLAAVEASWVWMVTLEQALSYYHHTCCWVDKASFAVMVVVPY